MALYKEAQFERELSKYQLNEAKIRVVACYERKPSSGKLQLIRSNYILETKNEGECLQELKVDMLSGKHKAGYEKSYVEGWSEIEIDLMNLGFTCGEKVAINLNVLDANVNKYAAAYQVTWPTDTECETNLIIGGTNIIKTPIPTLNTFKSK